VLKAYAIMERRETYIEAQSTINNRFFRKLVMRSYCLLGRRKKKRNKLCWKKCVKRGSKSLGVEKGGGCFMMGKSWVIPSPKFPHHKTTINLPSCFGAENNSNVIGISQQERTKNMPSHIQKSMQQYVSYLMLMYRLTLCKKCDIWKGIIFKEWS